VTREGEHFIPEHIFSYQVAGTMTISDGIRTFNFKEGDFRFSRRNQLAKFAKYPPAGGQFRSISITLDPETLRSISMDYGYTAEKKSEFPSVVPLPPEALYRGYIDSLQPYLELKPEDNEPLFALKVKEIILLLLKINPELTDTLFDFTAPGKIDLEEFMTKNFHFNVSLDRFAYLSGRSLATFKRDFEKIFKTTPSRWLQQRRLQEAYYLITEKRRKPSDVYLDIGFEDLSHFSFAFKNAFGFAPSKIAAGQK
jgi:AraC-like DNA-binding protein